MKRSNIFLGLTTCLLGVAALAASKAKFTTVTAYYSTTDGVIGYSLCLSVSQINLTVNGILQATVRPSDPHYARFGLYTSADCVQPIFVGSNQ